MNPIVLNAGKKPMKNHAKTSQFHGLIESMEPCWRFQAECFVKRSLFKGPAKLLIRNARFSPELCRTIPLRGDLPALTVHFPGHTSKKSILTTNNHLVMVSA
jgi:hypothetical protein